MYTTAPYNVVKAAVFCLNLLYPVGNQAVGLIALHACAQVMTGSGSFESYVSVGASAGATPDGRLSGQPTASDCSPQPFPQVKQMTYLCNPTSVYAYVHGN